jgi:predicted nucleic acid-binding protein
VIDASLGAGAILAIKGMEKVPDLFIRWAEERRGLFAPDLWMIETASVIRQHVFRDLISAEQARQAIHDLESLEVNILPTDFDLLRNAFHWAEKIGQSKIYDSLYLALAERLNAEFWTADQRLVNSTRTLNSDWVKWFGETE